MPQVQLGSDAMVFVDNQFGREPPARRFKPTYGYGVDPYKAGDVSIGIVLSWFDAYAQEVNQVRDIFLDVSRPLTDETTKVSASRGWQRAVQGARELNITFTMIAPPMGTAIEQSATNHTQIYNMRNIWNLGRSVAMAIKETSDLFSPVIVGNFWLNMATVYPARGVQIIEWHMTPDDYVRYYEQLNVTPPS